MTVPANQLISAITRAPIEEVTALIRTREFSVDWQTLTIEKTPRPKKR